MLVLIMVVVKIKITVMKIVAMIHNAEVNRKALEFCTLDLIIQMISLKLTNYKIIGHRYMCYGYEMNT